MEKYAILLGYMDKQSKLVEKLRHDVVSIDLSVYEARYVFALKTQQLYTALEDLLKQVAKAFENHVKDLSLFHKELLVRLHTEIPSIRPRLLSDESFVMLDKIRSFRHFIRHAYDCELLESELQKIQDLLKGNFSSLEHDISAFRKFVSHLL